MEQQEGTQKTSVSNKVVIIAAAMVVAAALAVIAALLLTRGQDDSLGIGYATDASVMLDQDSLQNAMDAAIANARDKNISLMYKNDAYSANGLIFSCYIVNSPSNLHDMFLNIYADSEMQDQLFLSKLVPPGSGFEEITLERTLDPGDHRVYVVLTQVTTSETGAQTAVGQVVHTMDFHVAAD